MASSPGQTQTTTTNINTRIIAQGTVESALSTSDGRNPEISTYDALNSPRIPAFAPTSRFEGDGTTTATPAQQQSQLTTPQQTGVTSLTGDEITSGRPTELPGRAPSTAKDARMTDSKTATQEPTAKDAYFAKKKPNEPEVPTWRANLQQPASDTVVALEALQTQPGQVDCPRCQRVVVTKVELVNGTTVTTWGAVLCLVGGICCAFIPTCIDDCKDCDHHCWNCGLKLMTHTAGGNTKMWQQTVPPPGGFPEGRPTKEPYLSAFVQQRQQKAAAESPQQQSQAQRGIQQSGDMFVHHADSTALAHMGPPLEKQGSEVPVPQPCPQEKQITGVTDGIDGEETRGAREGPQQSHFQDHNEADNGIAIERARDEYLSEKKI